MVCPTCIGIRVDAVFETQLVGPARRPASDAGVLNNRSERNMANKFGTDILIQAQDPKLAASFYVQQLGFEITDAQPDMISLHGKHINLFIERGPRWAGVGSDGRRRRRSQSQTDKNGCEIVRMSRSFRDATSKIRTA